MRVLVACEFSGVVRDAFRRRGHEAWSCDLLPSESRSGQHYHYQGDIFRYVDMDWDLMIAHPPCTYLSVSGLHWNKSRPERARLTDEAITFVRRLLDVPIRHTVVENPVGCLSTVIRKPEQIIQPYQFGDDASKRTCLWLKDVPPLRPTHTIAPRLVGGKPRWANQTDSGQNRLGPSEDRWKLRSVTYPGIAAAMAAQWGELTP